jgi:hypothetical protein
MELNAENVKATLYPTALHAPACPRLEKDQVSTSLEDSLLAPQELADDLDPDTKIRWRMDGSDTDGRRFYAVPDFAIGQEPIRIDIFSPEQSRIIAPWNDMMQLNTTMVLGSTQISRQAFLQHLLRGLEFWSSKLRGFEDLYMSMPYGSLIVIENVVKDFRSMQIEFYPVYSLEQNWLSFPALLELWQLPQFKLPETIDLGQLLFQYQLHEAIALVRIAGIGHDKLYVYKSLTHDPRYMYHEMKMLLSVDPHPSIISRPIYLVTKVCRFGSKIGVCGMILEYHPAGNLREALRPGTKFLKSQGDRLNCAIQITSALIHIRDSPVGFYSDLKPQNIVISTVNNNVRALLVDFEQRGGWYSWSPPEVCYIDYFDHLAMRAPKDARKTYCKTLTEFAPEWVPRLKVWRYDGAAYGYNASWNVLTPAERDSAVVFMLGKMLWCLMEGIGSMSGMILSVEGIHDHDGRNLMFPHFQQTPDILRDCIKRCTASAPEWRGQNPCVILRNNKLYPYGKSGFGKEPLATAEETQQAATEWWTMEIKEAEQYLKLWRQHKLGEKGNCADDDLIKSIGQRPRLEEVLQALECARSQLKSSV